MYAFIKEKAKNIERHMTWDEKCFNTVCSIFEYEDLPLAWEFIEAFAIGTGLTAIWECDGEWICSYATRTSGDLNPYGRLTDLTCYTRNGKTKVFKDFENPESPDYNKVAIIKNNRFEQPEKFFHQYADVLAEIDKSIVHIIKNSRMTPIAVCKDEMTLRAIKSALDSNNNGEVQAVLSDNILQGEENAYVLNLTDVNASSLIQYLYKAKDDELRHFYQHYGICGSGEAKMAQLTEAEVEKGNNSHLIEVYEMLKTREACIEELNKKFGWNAKVKFSTCWEREDAHHDPESIQDEETEVEMTGEEEVENEETVQDREPSEE